MRQYGIDPSQFTQGHQSTSGQSQSQQLTPQQPAQQATPDIKAPRQEGDDAKPVRFGLNLFNADNSTFSVVNNAPVPADYVIGVNDVFNVQLYGKESQQLSLPVERDGSVSFPDLGPLHLAGLTFAKAQQVIEDRVAQQMIGVKAAVTMNTLRTISVFVAGEAKKPGAYAVPALTTVTQALFLAGGVSDIGSLRNIVVKRSGKTVRHFDLYSLLLRGDASDDIRLQSGDVVFIPPYVGLAEAKGEVRRPALYEIKKGETLSDLLAMAGGVDAGGYPQASVLERINSHNLRDVENVDLTKRQALNTKLRAGDVLRVGVTSSRYTNAITLAGAVVRPGQYAWHKGMHVHDLIPSLWANLKLSADLDYALIVREVNALGDISVKQFSLGNAITHPNSSDDLALQPHDKVLVFNADDSTLDRSKLSRFISKHLQEVVEQPAQQRWLSDDLLTRGFSLLQNQDKAQKINSVAGVTIDDAVSKKAQQDANNSSLQNNDLSDSEQQQLLLRAVTQLLAHIYQNPKTLALTPQMTRQELLYPIIQKLKNQAGQQLGLALVSISGDVKVPGEYPLTDNATVKGLVEAAGGVKDSAFMGRAELTRAMGNRANMNGIRVAHQAVDLAGALRGDASNLKLQSRDHLNVFATPDWQVDRTVQIRGEVKFPGTYTIQRGESLSDVLKRAGGVTHFAFTDGAVFTREQVKARESLQVNKLIDQLRSDVATRALSAERAPISYQDAMAMINELQKLKPVGRLVIDLPDILKGDKTADLQVNDGDVLYIPRKTDTISVVGEVQNASSHRFKSGLTVDDYLNLSGGFRKRADERRVYVIRADGSVMIPGGSSWFSSNHEQLRPGDTIVVPLDTEYMNKLSTWSSVTQIIYQSAVALAAISTL
ncbi:SLBB domain-containing protein [Gallaecimonas sp. GXIMD1310]|uniref:SLBB domain-containing protein n=1 Tax=Gallaecimonas sp. GXIMD1310 TaxID=3131926 RepID=UPI003254EAA9